MARVTLARRPGPRPRSLVAVGTEVAAESSVEQTQDSARSRADSGEFRPAGARRASAGPTELVLEGRLDTDPDGVGWTLKDEDCPLEGADAFDHTTGEWAWRPTCKNARCRRCSRQVSAQTFALARRALEPIEHVRFITGTRLPEGWEPTRQAVRTWLQNLRRQGYEMNVLWVVERGDDTGMKHFHAVQHGDFIPKNVLDESWPYGWNEIEGARAATDYLGKGVIRYVGKNLDGNGEDIEAHMNLNGGRAAHWSRGFFGGLSREAYRKANPMPGIYFVRTDMPDRRLSGASSPDAGEAGDRHSGPRGADAHGAPAPSIGPRARSR